MRRAVESRSGHGLVAPMAGWQRWVRPFGVCGLLGLWLPTAVLASNSPAVTACPRERAIYLTFDTGHMGVAPWVAQVLQRQRVRASFFLANEATLDGGSSLDAQWAPWWRARVAEGHVFASHTWDHWVWKGVAAPAAGTPAGTVSWWVTPTAGPQKGQRLRTEPSRYCAQLMQPLDWLRGVAPQARIGRAFRAPAGRTSPELLAATQACGFTHVPWTEAGFLGDELPSEQFPNDRLLQDALRRVKPGEILLVHLGIWSRRDPWAPAVLEPLIEGLKTRGLCFSTLAEHPRYAHAWALRP
jgi:peptidoglycan/xylan/chitin deacetylase (PgdA/CDA1 family)